MWFRPKARGTGDPARVPGASRTRSLAGRPLFEALEKKEMLSADAPRVLDIVADNRGFVQVTLDADLLASSVNQQSVRFFTSGDDGLLGTADDVQVAGVEVSYNFGERRITADARLVADTAYSVLLDGSIIRDVENCFLDGEFNGAGVPTGDGVEGGDLEFFARLTGPTIARVATNLGDIDVELFANQTPLHVANFLRYANDRLYDGVIFHRSVEGFVIQGGGFESSLPFLPIPSFDPVQNEPGISNLRGTLALAKLGGDPNSGTNQWFFNLGDNAANLDNQNGGFTVFGEAMDDASLAVIDAIGALDTFNATATNGAFTDVPVLDLDLVNTTSGVLMERDVVEIRRVSRLLTVSAEPFGQIDTDEVEVITRDGSNARVTLYSIDGTALGNVEDFISVNFGGADAINSITFTSAPPAMVGLQITGASRVGSITERGQASGQLAFIYSTSTVGEIRIATSIEGFQLNGVLLADGVLVPEDLDNDNVFDDATSVYIETGTTRSLRFDDGFSGDVLLPGGLTDLRVRGVSSMGDVRVGPNANDATLRVQMGTVRDVALVSDALISSIRADEWGPFLTQNARLVAPSIERLDIRGDFLADLTVTDSLGEGLRRATIRGDVLRSRWRIFADLGRLRFDDAATWTLEVSGDALVVRGKETRNLTVDVSGELRDFRVDEIDGGVIDAASALRFSAAKGDVVADITFGAGTTDMRRFDVGGDLSNSSVVLGSDVRSFKVKGDISDSTINGQGFRNLAFKRVSDTDFVSAGLVRQVRAISWNGGLFQASETRAFRTTGNTRLNDPGDFRADYTVSNSPRVMIAGDIADSDFRVGDSRLFRVGGDVVDSEVRFFQLFFLATIAANTIDVDGSMLGSQLYVGGNLDSISADAMIDSAIYVGSTGTLDGFPNQASINPGARVRSVIVRGITDGQADFVNSFIGVGRADYVRVTNPEFQNSEPFGVAGGQLDRVEVVSPDLAQGFNSVTDGVVVMDDLQIRGGFQTP